MPVLHVVRSISDLAPIEILYNIFQIIPTFQWLWHQWLSPRKRKSSCFAIWHHSEHYSTVIMSTMTSLITSPTIVYSTVYSGADKKNIKAPRHWPLFGELTGDRWIPHTKGQWRGKCFHLMTSSCSCESLKTHIAQSTFVELILLKGICAFL